VPDPHFLEREEDVGRNSDAAAYCATRATNTTVILKVGTKRN
jgi:hypothetical protein